MTAALALRGSDPARALELLLAEEKEAKRRGDGRAQAIAMHRAGDVALDLGRCDEAERYYVDALEEHRARGDLKLLAVAANDLGLHGNACQKDPIAWFQLSVETREQLGDDEALRVGLSNLGGAAMLWRPPAEARPILERALAVAERLGDVDGERKAHINLAAALMYLARERADGGPRPGATDGGDDPEREAFRHLERALALGGQLGLTPEDGACHGLPTDLWWMCGSRGLKVLRGSGDFEGEEEPPMPPPADVDLTLPVGERAVVPLKGVLRFEVADPKVVEVTLAPAGRGLRVKGLRAGETSVLVDLGGATRVTKRLRVR